MSYAMFLVYEHKPGSAKDSPGLPIGQSDDLPMLTRDLHAAYPGLKLRRRKPYETHIGLSMRWYDHPSGSKFQMIRRLLPERI